MTQGQGLGGVDRRWRWRLAPPGQNGDDEIVAGGSGVEGFTDRVVDCVQAIDQHCRQHANKPSVGFVAAAELAPQSGQGRRQRPVQERRAVAQSAGLAGQHRQVMPGIIDRPPPAEAAGVFGHHLAGAAHDDAVGVGAHLDRALGGLGHHRVAVAVEGDQAGAADGVLGLVEAVERGQDLLQRRPFGFQRLGQGDLTLFRMGMLARPAQALGFQPAVQLLQAGELQARLEEPVAA